MTATAPPPPRQRPRLTVAAFGAVIAVATAALGLAYSLSPSLKPDPGTSVSAELRVMTVEPDARYGDWVARLPAAQRRDAAGIPKEVLDARGFIVYLQVQVDGRKRHEIEMTQGLYSVRSRAQLVAPENVLGFTSDTPSDRWVATAFVHDPGFGEKVFGRYELLDHGVILAFADTTALAFPTPNGA
ncbi:MAG: hypothetical protein AAGC46_16790 [Solirubrobacteraceae bacterium]